METKQIQNWLNGYSVKMVVVVTLTLILLIPQMWIKSIIEERIHQENQVKRQMADQWGNQQVISGLTLNIPFTYRQSAANNSGFVDIQSIAHFLPDDLLVNAKLSTETRKRGIYKIPVYDSEVKIKGHFIKPDFSKIDTDPTEIRWNEAYFTIGISDLRGIKDSVKLNMNKSNYTVEPGVADNDIFSSGITIKTDELNFLESIPFDIDLKLNGTSGFFVEAIGKNSEINVNSTWPDPSFTGSFLPAKREVSKDGFSATWIVTHLNRNFPQQWYGKKHKTESAQLGVSLLLPVDHYQKSIRSIKYAILFIALNFIVFLFIEIRNKKRIHPIQYTLVALALLLFYTLLTSIGEQIGFNAAYGISALAITGLISWYSFSILKDKKQMIWITSLQIGLYVFMFTILQLQDYALLMGSIGLFFVLGIIMNASRKVSWYNNNEG